LVTYPGGLTATQYTVPATVKTIANAAFSENENLKSVTMPAAKMIGSNAFSECYALKSVTMSAVDTISSYAFYYCKLLENVTLSNTATYLGEHCFEYCSSLSSINLSDSLKYIGSKAFGNNEQLTSITIPASVEYISHNAFQYCSNLLVFYVDDKNAYYTDDNNDGVLYTKDKTVLIAYPAKKSGNTYKVADECKVIGGHAFSDATQLTSIILPEELGSIEGWAFANCSSIEQIDLPASLSYFHNGSVFYGCKSLSTVTLPESNANYVVKDNVVFSKDTTTLVAYAPGNTQTSYEIPETVDSILWEAFFEVQNLKKVTFPANVKYIDGYAFACEPEHLIDTIVCKASKPIENISSIAFTTSTYGDELYEHAVLVVPDGSKAKYQATYPWSEFATIIEMSEVSAVESVENNNPATDNKIYDLQGRQLKSAPQTGVYIKNKRKFVR